MGNATMTSEVDPSQVVNLCMLHSQSLTPLLNSFSKSLATGMHACIVHFTPVHAQQVMPVQDLAVSPTNHAIRLSILGSF